MVGQRRAELADDGWMNGDGDGWMGGWMNG